MKVSRRAFVVGGAAAGAAIVIGIKLPRIFGKESVPGPFQAWVRLTPDGKLALVLAQSEMGQGVSTGLPMILADEAGMDFNDVSVVQAETDPSLYNHLGTGGSHSTMRNYEPLRKAGAQIRALMIAAAAQQWSVPAGECAAAGSMVTHAASGRKATYAQLFKAAAALPVPSAESVKLKEASQFTLIGKEVQRIDVPSKVNGSARFGLDVRLPGMVYAVIARCPTFGGKAASFDAKKALAVPGVQKVFEVPATGAPSFTAGGIAVVAENTWAAFKGREALDVTWDQGPHAGENSPALRKQLLDATNVPGKKISESGNVEQAFRAAARRVDAVYEFPFLAHATMEPMNLTAHRTEGGIELWAPTQSPDWIQGAVAHLLKLSPKDVVVHTTWMGGGFGRRYHTDFGVEAAQIAEVVRQPVQLVWSREDDIAHDFYRPAACHRMAGALDAEGNPVAWLDRLASTSIRAFWNPAEPAEEQEIDGLGNPYALPNFRLEYAPVASGTPRMWWRSVAASFNGFAVECFVDELAAAAKADPFEFRRKLLKAQEGKNPEQPHYADRLRTVLETAVARSDWGKPIAAGRGRGLAAFNSFDSYIAYVAEVTVKGNNIKVDRVVAAVDCGRAINPNGVRSQVEGAIIFGLSAALKGEITIKNGAAEQTNFDGYDLVRMPEAPAVEVYFVESGADLGGMGEPGVPPIAPAVANAVFAATGIRLRKLPFDLSGAKS
ncbi:MAG TPA: xanthine dehydrogenase family protein molybdopterin-binding subunit [Terriglobales bacterium]|jgi:isoquinoline 1-oxidoreductase beta subunit|nr:xanthine dehydrogenase family protein molybdopterin-binding subunit [Terriglobales bacterium]